MYKALVSFSGLISMRKGEVRELTDLAIIKDLLNAGYIEAVEEKKAEKTKKKTK